MANFKIYDAPNGDNLCARCRNATYIQGHRASEVLVYCSEIGQRRIDFPVRRCNDFDDRSKTELWEMKKLAWLVASDKKGTVGFYSQRDFDRLKKDGAIVADPFNRYDDE